MSHLTSISRLWSTKSHGTSLDDYHQSQNHLGQGVTAILGTISTQGWTGSEQESSRPPSLDIKSIPSCTFPIQIHKPHLKGLYGQG